MTKRSRKKRIAAWYLVLVMLLTVVNFPGTAQEVSAAGKKNEPKSISVTTKNPVLGAKKVLYVGGPANLKSLSIKAKVKPAKASQKVTFKSSSTKKAKVTSSGKVTAKKAGKVKITVASKTKKKVKKVISIQIKKYVYPTALTLKSSATELSNGATAKVTATLAPKNVTFKDVIFSSSDNSLAQVSANGVVTADKTKSGIVKIIATAKYKNKSNKSVSASVSISINPGGKPQQPQKPEEQEQPKSYNIYYEMNGGTATGSAVNPTSYVEGVGVASFADAYKAGYTFDGWYFDSDCTQKAEKIPADATGYKTIFAKFTPNVYNITYVLNDGTMTVTGDGLNPTSYTVGEGVAADKIADAKKDGVYFGGWYFDSEFKKRADGIAKDAYGDKTLYARFSSPATSVQMTVDTKQYVLSGSEAGKKVIPTVEVTPSDAGYRYVSSDPNIIRVDESNNVYVCGIGKATLTVRTFNGLEDSCELSATKSTANNVHDPSIFKDPKSGKYYTIGTGLGMVESTDLKAWSGAAKSGAALFKKGIKELAPLYEYTKCDQVIGSFWAADLIYNKDTDEYNMYLCATCGNGYFCKTAIIMCSSTKVTGPYSYKGTIVCADFNKTTIEDTNIREALGLSKTDKLPSYYWSENDKEYVRGGKTYPKTSDYYATHLPDAIDPQPFYGHDGQLYLSYGSFTSGGGIRILRLGKDGLRDPKLNYEDDTAKNGLGAPYFGKQIVKSGLGEGPYILKVKTPLSKKTGYYYYIFTSEGSLKAEGDYRMRVSRAEYPDGPFTDMAGTSAMDGGGSILAYNYRFGFMPMAYTSMGGNSALVDDDGKIYVAYHNKFSDGSGDPGFHLLKVHQAFLNEDGWLVMAPFEYNGETIAASYSAIDIAGDYEFIKHDVKATAFPAVPGADRVCNYKCKDSVKLKLTADGKAEGGINGTWTISGNNITITVPGKTTDSAITYKGVMCEGYQDCGTTTSITALNKTLTFTAVGSDKIAIWGSKIVETDQQKVALDLSKITLPEEADKNFTLPDTQFYGSTFKWTSSDSSLIEIDGTTAKVNRKLNEKEVTLTVTAQSGTYTDTKEFTVKLPEAEFDISTVINTDSITLPSELGGVAVTWTSGNTDVITIAGTTATVKRPATTSVTVVLTAHVGAADSREIKFLVMPINKPEPFFTQDFTNAQSTVFYSQFYQAGATIETDADSDRGKYLQYHVGSQNSRGGTYDFGISNEKLNSAYTVECDFMIKGGDRDKTWFALYAEDADYEGTPNPINNGIKSGYIFSITAEQDGDDRCMITGKTETLDIAGKWVHLSVTVDVTTKKADVIITNGNEVVYSGIIDVSGAGVLKGLYIRGGRYQGYAKVDNIVVY